MEDIEESLDQEGVEWATRISEALKDRALWYKRCERIKKLYSDKRDNNPMSQDAKRFNILWSNTQTILPVLLSRDPETVVMPRDFVKSPDAEQAAIALKRTLETQMKQWGFSASMKKTVLEYLLTSQGIGWTTYEPEFAPDGITKVNEAVKFVYLNYKDFITNKCRVWDEVTFVGRKHRLSRKECKSYFPEEYLTIVYDENGKFTVWEIWDKTENQQLFVAPDQLRKILKRQPIPINFDDVFPCPPALLGNVDNESIIPVPDYVMYQDQADDLNKYTARLSRIGDALKVRGTYSSQGGDLNRLFEENQENVLVPTNTPMDKAPFQFVPLDVFANAATQIASLKAGVKQDIYELTGISDIVRGASDPNETATAQQIKNQWGGLRIRERQKDVQVFVRNAIRLMAEIVAEHFDSESIFRMSGIRLTPEQEQILRNGANRNFIIEVETDSTIEPDAQQEKQERGEFLQAMAGYLETAAKISQFAPELTPMLAEMVEFGLRAFPVGTEMQSRISQSLNQMVQSKMQSMQNPKPDPEEEKLKVDQFKAQTDRMQVQADAMLGVEELNLKQMQSVKHPEEQTQENIN